MRSLSSWFAAVCAALLVLVPLIGFWAGSGPQPPAKAPSGPKLPAIIPFAPSSDFAGEHGYGLWTLFCRAIPTGAAIGEAPAAPTNPDLDAALAPPAIATSRCVTHAAIRVGQPPQVLASFNVTLVGAAHTPFVVFQVPAAAGAEKFVHFAVDRHEAFRAPLSGCDAGKCIVQTALPQEALAQMLQGTELRLRIYVGEAKQALNFGFPLHGFRESVDALKLAQPPPA